jgi:hypothetical protein
LALVILRQREFRIVQIKSNPLPQRKIIAQQLKFTESFYNLLKNQHANFNKTWYKSSLGKGNIKLHRSMAMSSSKGDNNNNAKLGRVI